MGNKTRAAQQAYRAGDRHRIDANGTYTINVAPFDDMLAALVAVDAGGGRGALSQITVRAVSAWLDHADENPPGKRPQCLICGSEFAGLRGFPAKPSYLAVVEGSTNSVSVSCLCSVCGVGKTKAEATSIFINFFHDTFLDGDLEIVGSGVSWERH